MTRTACRTTFFAVLLASATVLGATAGAAEEPAAKNTRTVWVDGKGQSGFAEKIDKVHAEMEASGWKFTDLEIYTEDGDMKGAFVTYTR